MAICLRPQRQGRARRVGWALGIVPRVLPAPSAKDPAMKRTPIKRSPPRESAAKREVHREFNRVVLDLPCYFRSWRDCEYCNGPYGHEHGVDLCPSCGGTGTHRCSGRKDAHHLVEQQWLKRNYSDLPEDMLLTI